MRRYADLVRHGGNKALFQAAELSVLSTRLGWPFHIHAEGVRGTGKTSILRSVRDVLPRIKRIRGCLYNCTPGKPHCPHHKDLTPREIRAIGTEWVPMPFLEVSHSAKLGTVVGTIDLGRITQGESPSAVLLPGTLAKAHRGIVFIDEINRLADTAPELADVLLDVMGTRPGRLQIEESGLPPVALPLQVSVWAASNPDEEPGPLEDIRRQLADRFDFTVPVSRPDSPAQVRRILDSIAGAGSRVEASDGKEDSHLVETRRMRRRRMALLARTGRALPELGSSERDLLAQLYVRYDLESLRAVEAWQWAARVAAQRAGRRRVGRADLLAVAALVLGHRVEARVLSELLAELAGTRSAQEQMLADSAGGHVHSPPDSPAGSGPGHGGRQKGHRDDGAGLQADYPLDRFGGINGTMQAESRSWGTTSGRSRSGSDTGGLDGAGARAVPVPGGASPGQGTGHHDGAAGSGSNGSNGSNGWLQRLRSWLGEGWDEDHPDGGSDQREVSSRGDDGFNGAQSAGSGDPGLMPAPPNRATALRFMSPHRVYRRLIAAGAGLSGHAGSDA